MAKAKAAVVAVDFPEGDNLLVNWDDIEEQSFEAIPRGNYPCIISECDFQHSQAAGNPMWSIRLEVEGGEYDGRILFTHMVFAGKALGFTKATLARIAPELLESALDPQDEEAQGSLLGKHVTAKVTTRMYEGELTNNVRGLYALEEGGDDFV